jgi:hypothetical protein
VALLALHVALAIWGAARNSVTFDENFHLPAGVEFLVRGDPTSSIAQPPLAKSLCALGALAAGAEPPADSSLGFGAELSVGESFMRVNAARFHRVFFAGRLVTIALSVMLGLLVWRFARRLYGESGALLALAAYALAPETLAHAAVVGVDLATALGLVASVYTFWIFCRTGRWRWWVVCALSVGLTFLTRFSAFQLIPMFVILAAWGTATGRLARPGRTWLGIAMFGLTTLAILNLGYLGKTSLAPMGEWPAQSSLFKSVARAHPGWRVPLPDAYLAGVDYIASIAKGDKPAYLLGRSYTGGDWRYFPIALLVKWPAAFLALLVLRLAWTLRSGSPRAAWHEAFLLVPAGVVLVSAMASSLEYGVRYVFPMVPFLCVWCGGLAATPLRLPARARARAQRWARVAAVLVVLQAVEMATAAPYPLSFFNVFAGGPGRGDRIVNDSNVDWGQGLLALRDEMKRRGIARVHLAYHGTTDPAIYGIQSVPYRGGVPGPESDWLAVSSYYFVGLSARMMTPQGPTDFLTVDFKPLWSRPPDARPAHCMVLFRLR